MLSPECREEVACVRGAHLEKRSLTREIDLSLTGEERRGISLAQVIEVERHRAAVARRVRAVLVADPLERVVMSEEQIPVGGKEIVEGDHLSRSGGSERAACGGLSLQPPLGRAATWRHPDRHRPAP